MCPSAATVVLAMRRLLLVAVVMILVVAGLPLLVGMAGMVTCPQCPPALPAFGQCLAVLAGAAVVLALLLSGRLRSPSNWLRPWLYARLFERPPQLV
jgi:hypothetical protein